MTPILSLNDQQNNTIISLNWSNQCNGYLNH